MRSEWGDPPAYADGGGGGGLRLPRMTTVTKALLWSNGIAFLLLVLVDSFTTPAQFRGLIDFIALSPQVWWDHFPLVPLWQLVTYGFLHSTTDAMHVLFNMLALYFFGTMVEGIVGPRRFLVTYVTAVLLGGVAQLTFGLVLASQGAPSYPTLGASGAVMCIIIAAAVMMPETRVIFILFPLKLRTLAMILVGLDVFRMLRGGTGVAWLVHLTGAGYGFMAVRRRWIWRDPLQDFEDRLQRSRAGRESDDRERLDALLERINREGMTTLSRAEKAFLKRMSARKR